MTADSGHRIVAVVLAAGISSRMGRPKLLMPWEEHTVIEETLTQVLGAGYEEVVVVVGSEREEMQELLSTRPVRVAFNLNYRAGMSGSIKAGVSFFDATATAFAIVLGDQPQITTKIHQLVLANFRRSKMGICVPVYEGQYGHPVVFGIQYKPRMYALQGDNGAQSVVEAHPDDVAELALKSPEIIPSIDTQKDYEALVGS